MKLWHRTGVTLPLAPALLLFLLNSVAFCLDLVETEDHIITKIARDVYAIRHKKAARIGALSGNTTVIIGDREALVVDSCLLPSIARSDIELIRQWTDKPVRYLVNTHWHGDHTWGNGTYLDSFPGISIIAHSETSRLMQGYLPNFIQRNIQGAQQIKEILKNGKDENGNPITAELKAQLEADIPNAEMRAVEYKSLVTQLPNVTFEKELQLNLGNREVQLKFLGRGNTSGDIIVYLPQEKVVVAGDLIVYPFPFLIGGFPSEWSKTIHKIGQLQAGTIVPGHGAVLAGNDAKDYLHFVRELLETVTTVVIQETFKAGNGSDNLEIVMEAVNKSPEVAALRKQFAEDDADKGANFDNALPGLIRSAYREAWGN